LAGDDVKTQNRPQATRAEAATGFYRP
jgi:hypothetical protein